MHRLSKSKFLLGHQCHRRLWLETHERDSAELGLSVADQAILDRGKHVGEVARSYVPGGVLIDAPHTEPELRVAETRAAIEAGATVIYEAAFLVDHIFVAVDILQRNGLGWVLTEVKSTTAVKPEHLIDAAVQAHVLRRAGLRVSRIEIMHLNRECVFPDLSNLFLRVDVTSEVDDLLPGIPRQAKRQLSVLNGSFPEATTGDHCFAPYECPFMARCWPPAPEHHVDTLYRLRRKRAAELVENGYQTIHDLPDDLVFNAVAERQRRAVREGRMIIEPGLADALSVLESPVAHLDFETVNPPIPCWPGCRPYDAIPAQLSVHHDDGRHHEWIADGPGDPREQLAIALINALRGARTIAAYHSPFERRCIEHLRDNLPHLAHELDDVLLRVVDVLPIVRDHVYHPSFNGRFGLKSVYPVLVSQTGYDGLDVVDGMTASVELERLMFDGTLSEGERSKLRASLLEYCGMDTRALAMVVQRLREMCCCSSSPAEAFSAPRAPGSKQAQTQCAVGSAVNQPEVTPLDSSKRRLERR